MGNREKLRAAARECLLTIGYERTTVRHLVAASGANQASINYHFGSKEQLLTEVLQELNREWGDVLFAALAAGPAEPGGTAQPAEAGGESRPADHEALWGRVIDSIRENRALWFVNFESLSSAYVDEEIRAMIADGQRVARQALARAFDGPAAPDDPAAAEAAEAAGARYYATLVGVAAQWLIDPDAAPTARQIAAAAPAR
ncbi:helix-turn-helix domain-containing protein [Agromyces sp. G08B096]|uniref:Helix-turn-helix domain-containing protein n=1 Tax=Agromyces sp. G08B096 TaxID=3156399 RepID=A0AAU7W858_9MICO